MECDVLVIGAGLCGLSLASQLHSRGVDIALAEARSRVGGRIETVSVSGASFDLGPAWFWPGQSRIAQVIEAHGLDVFEQYARGALLYEDEKGQVHRDMGFASMQGSFRLAGGLSAITDALLRTLPASAVHLETPISKLVRRTDGVDASTADGKSIQARHVVLAMPPRLAEKIAFDPPLEPSQAAALASVPTWMAGQAKAVAVYDTSFWRESGLSGDAMSRVGPMVEMHDASPEETGPYAIFGFIGVLPQQRADEDQLRAAILGQLVRIFGPKAQTPISLSVKDWAADPFTATSRDAAPLRAHPSYRPIVPSQSEWASRVTFSGSETAPQFGGYLEGALEAAEISLGQVQSHMSGQHHDR